MTRDEIISANPIEVVLQKRGMTITGSGVERKSLCPFHSDKTPSFEVNVDKQLWVCRAGCGGGSVIDLIAKLDGISPAEAMARLSGNVTHVTQQPTARPKLVKTYDYTNAHGVLVYQACRLEPKSFRQRRPNPLHNPVQPATKENPAWLWDMNGVDRVLYQLPKVLKAKTPVWVLEGERDCDTATALSFTATCNVGGAGKWLDGYTATLEGKDIVICGDNDEPGQKHVIQIMESLAGKAKSVRLVSIPKPHKDFTQYTEAFQTDEEKFDAVMRLYNDAPIFDRGINIAVKTISEIEQEFIASIKHSQTRSFDLGGWLPSLRKYVRPIIGGEMIAIIAGTGVGKCLGKGTEVLMFDGSTKRVEDIESGEKVMGSDSRARNVLSIGSGREDMFRVIQKNGDDYTCNKSHILSLQTTSCPGRTKPGQIVNISVSDYMKKCGKFKHIHKGYKVGVAFAAKAVALEPYFLGLWLGDGNSDEAAITTGDAKLKKYFLCFAERNGLSVRCESGCGCETIYLIRWKKRLKWCGVSGCNKPHNAGGWCKDHYAYKRYHEGFSAQSECGTNIKDSLRLIGVLNNKHIPNEYLVNSEEARLSLLAGLIDSDGYSGETGTHFCNTNERLARDVMWLARSLGFKTYLAKKKTSIKSTGYIGEAWVISLYGAVSKIPVLLPRKLGKDSVVRKALRYGITVENIGFGDYYGFELDGDGLFLLGDFTVTHNTSLVQNLAVNAAPLVTLLFEQELPNPKVFERFVALVTETPCQEVFASYSNDKAIDWRSTGKLDHILVCPRSMLTAEQIEELIIKSELKTGGRPALVIVDYIQLMGGKGERRERIASAAEGLKAVAKNTNTVMVIVSQIGRKVGNKEVTLHDGKEAGEIENSSGLVLGAWRVDNDPTLLKMRVLKNTSGSSGALIECNFDGPRMMITERAKEEREQEEESQQLPYKD